MTTGSANNVSATGAALSASYSGVQSFQAAGFYVGTSSSLASLVSSGQVVYSQSALTIGSGSFSATAGGLDEDKTYYYIAFMEVLVDGTYKEVYGSVKSFRTLSASTSVTLNKDWLELPESPSSLGGKYLVTMRGTLNEKDVRNYSILYDPSRYASLWTAYVYSSAYHGSGTGSGWTVNPQIPASQQTSCKSAYPSVDGVTYDRGHQIPNADRNADNSLQNQTYYWTNSTPQHASFNQGIWNNLENQVRNMVSSSDSVYVVTGPAFAIDAIAAGKEAAISIHRYVHEGQTLDLGRDHRDYKSFDKDTALVNPGFDRAPRQHPADAGSAVAKKTFDDLRAAFTEEQMQTECARCLGCGVAVVDEFMCVGCGVCTTKCKFDAISLEKIHDAGNTEYFRTLSRIVASVPGKGINVAKKHFGKYGDK